MVNFTYSALVAVLHERLFRNALQLRLHKQKLKIYLTTFGAAQKQPLRGTFSMPSQELQGLAVEDFRGSDPNGGVKVVGLCGN